MGDADDSEVPIVLAVNISTFLQSGPVFVRSALPPPMRCTLDSACAAGRVVPVLPGTYIDREFRDDFGTRVAAVGQWNPKAVITGAAAARLTFWPELVVQQIDVARRGRVPHATGYRFHRIAVDRDHIHWLHGIRVASPAWVAVDLAGDTGGDSIDRCLRSRRARLEDLWAALAAQSGRRGNGARRRVLIDSRDAPWSAAERLGHRILRGARLAGWKANHDVVVEGRLYWIDIAFLAEKVAIEIDGRLHEDDPEVFQNDRYRQNALVRAGWVVLRFTYAMLVDDPDYVVRTIVAALALRS